MITLMQLLSLYIWTSIIEWGTHRWVMHRHTLSSRIFREHAIEHHRDWFPTCEATPEETPQSRINLRFEGRTLFWFMAASLPITAFAVVGTWLNAVLPLAWAALVWWIWSEIHDEMHFPRARWFARIPLFHFWHRWHCEHHRRQRKNFGIVCIGADFLLGTASMPTHVPGNSK